MEQDPRIMWLCQQASNLGRSVCMENSRISGFCKRWWLQETEVILRVDGAVSPMGRSVLGRRSPKLEPPTPDASRGSFGIAFVNCEKSSMVAARVLHDAAFIANKRTSAVVYGASYRPIGSS